MQVISEIESEDWLAANELMANYVAWRRRGGFEPEFVGAETIPFATDVDSVSGDRAWEILANVFVEECGYFGQKL